MKSFLNITFTVDGAPEHQRAVSATWWHSEALAWVAPCGSEGEHATGEPVDDYAAGCGCADRTIRRCNCDGEFDLVISQLRPASRRTRCLEVEFI